MKSFVERGLTALIFLFGVGYLIACVAKPAEEKGVATAYDFHPTQEASDSDFLATCAEKTDMDPSEDRIVPGVLCTFSNKTDVIFSVAEVVSNVPGVGVIGSITPTQMELPLYGVTMAQIEDSFLRLDGDPNKICVDYNTTNIEVEYTCPFLDISATVIP